MAFNDFGRLIEMNMELLRDENKRKKQRELADFHAEQTQRNQARQDRFRERQDKLSAEIMERGDRARQALNDKYLARNISEGRLNPALAGGMSADARTSVMASNPELFPGLNTKGKSGTGSSDNGLTTHQALTIASKNVGDAPITSGDQPVSDQIDKRAVDLLKKFSGISSRPAAGDFRKREAYSNAISQINLRDNLSTGLVDEEGNPLPAKGIEPAKGEQNFGESPDGRQAFRKFALAGAGRQLPSGGLPEETVTVKGFDFDTPENRAALNAPKKSKSSKPKSETKVVTPKEAKKQKTEAKKESTKESTKRTIFAGPLAQKARELWSRSKNTKSKINASQDDWNRAIKKYNIPPSQLNKFHAAARKIRMNDSNLTWQQAWEIAAKNF